MAEEEAPSATEGLAHGIVLMFRDLYIEIFAIMLPGTVFLCLLFLAIIVPSYDLYSNFGQTDTAALLHKLEGHTGLIVVLWLVIAYVLGQMLFRCDPKWPDIVSIRTHFWQRKPGNCVEEPGGGRDEYPYHALKRYLQTRGMNELAAYVTWEPDGWGDAPSKLTDSSRHRSKHFINQMKLRIKSVDDRLFFEVARNETHIRLMSSLWWMSLYLLFFSIIGIALSNASLYFADENILAKLPFTVKRMAARHSAYAMEFPLHAHAIIFPYIAIAISAYIIFVVNTFIHYQRVREIVFVLEIYHMVKYRFLRKMGRRAYLDEIIYGGNII